ncbi:hypothetical protein RND81_14G166700 [Saponaria officinalis]|uniref:Uncharacterized protein n=1 Tax=Saponaria officinalis TaxID=3572 RepID=A0AAW1GR28_SAPOF
MEKINYRSSSKNQQPIYLNKSVSEHPYGRFLADSQSLCRRKGTSSSSKMQGFWRKLRRMFKKEQRSFGSGHHSHALIVPYNSYTYAQNFDDQGSRFIEPENLCRSFSARFAGPSSTMFNRVHSVR